jgi:uncharacterized protein (TIGR03086 family)
LRFVKELNMTSPESRLDFGPPARQLKTLLSNVSDAQLDAKTPTEGTNVATLLDHFMGLTIAFTHAARKTTAQSATAGSGDQKSGPPQASAEHLDADWRRKLPLQIDELVAAWNDPSAWEGMAQAGGVTLPAHIMGVIGIDELVIHGWELARATGQPFDCERAHLEPISQVLSQSADTRGEGGPFGPVVPVPADAPLLDRVVGLSGRDPYWTP